MAHPVILPAIAAEAGVSQVQNCLGKLVSSDFEKKMNKKDWACGHVSSWHTILEYPESFRLES